MRKIEKYGKLIAMSAAALGMTAALTIESSLAYFTTYVSAGGGQVVNLGAQTTIHENLSDMTKHIVIKNDSPINDCFVRVKVFCGADVEITYTDEAGNWREGTDGYWYYEPVLPASPDPKKPSVTTPLDAKITVNVPEGESKDNFNMVVIQECTPAIYDENGEPSADWTTVFTGAGEEAVE